MANSSRSSRVHARAGIGALLVVGALTALPAVPAAATPLLQMPFTCGETWRAATRAGHGSKYAGGYHALDLNFPDQSSERGRPVVASAAGTVVTSGTDNGYGNLVEVDHGGGWVTLYAHLDRRDVPAGATVVQGQQLGTVGSTPNVAVHLHYEQVLDGNVQPVWFDGQAVAYATGSDGPSYTSRNCPVPYDWEVTGQAAYADATATVPLDTGQLTHGQTAWLAVTARNTGTATWTADGEHPVRLGTWAAPDRVSAVATSGWVSPTRAAAPREGTVAPGGIGTFTFPICAATEGSGVERFDLVAEGAGWFEDAGLGFHLDVASAPVLTPIEDGASDGLVRLHGDDRVETAVRVSLDSFTDATAGAVVLARSDDFPDALAGAPLAAARRAPLLLTAPTCLDGRVEDELLRVLPPGGTVFLLGGASALSPTIESRVSALGYRVVRLAGATRYETAAAVADRLDPDALFLTTGRDFPDAVVAGAAAADRGGAVLLTDGASLHPATERVIAAHADLPRFAIGGPATLADPGAVPVAGDSRFTTAAKVASRWFRDVRVVAVATGASFPDALAAAPHIARRHGPVLLSETAALPQAAIDYLAAQTASIDLVYVYGGTSAVSRSTARSAAAAAETD